ncbi:MAG: hypothetical protein ACUVRS_12615 [Armatimonadota bacterium]
MKWLLNALRLFAGVLSLCLCISVGTNAATYIEDFEDYSIGTLSGQNGWSKISGTGKAEVYNGNGPSLSGNKCVRLDNLSGSYITLRKNISDLVSSDKVLTIQYDVRNVTNGSGKYPTTFRFRILDSSTGSPAIGNMHYDGGAGPACQAWAKKGTSNGWAPGGPAWTDTGWHTVAWQLNYATGEFVSVTFDGTQYPQPGWLFAYNSQKADLMELYLSGPDGNNDIWEIDNIVLTSRSAPTAVSISEAKFLPDGSEITVQGVVSAVFLNTNPPMFYIQQSDPAPSGIQVRCTGPQPFVNQKVSLTGTLATDTETAERFILTNTGYQVLGSGTVKPIAMNLRALGGGTIGFQQGVYEGHGTNNIGLLVKVCGKVTSKAQDGSYIYIDDGSAINNPDGTVGVRVDLSDIEEVMRPECQVGHNVVVEGISSMHASGGNAYKMVRVRSTLDFTNYSLKTFKVMVLNFDPVVPSVGKRTHEALGWNDPWSHTIAYINDLKEVSGCWAQYQIVEWHDVDYFAHFTDGFQYSAQEFYDMWRSCGGGCSWHSGTADYYRIINDFGIAAKVAAGEIDEVFMFGPPFACAFWEAAMAGPSPYFINGGTYYVPAAGRNFAIMGFTYEREVGCMLEDFCHRAECIMSRVYRPPQWWVPTWPITNNWDRFRMYDKIKAGEAACGTCHYAPNSQSDYDWGNTTYVWSYCDDWLYNWPNLMGIKRWVNCSEWGNGDMRLHHLWWLKHLPRKPGINPDGKQNNWWKYICDFNSYPESR